MAIPNNKRVRVTASRGPNDEIVHFYDERDNQNQDPSGGVEIFMEEIDARYGTTSRVTLNRKLVVDTNDTSREQPHLRPLYGADASGIYVPTEILVFHMDNLDVSPVEGYRISNPTRFAWTPPTTDGAGGEGSFESVEFRGGEAVRLDATELAAGIRYMPD